MDEELGSLDDMQMLKALYDFEATMPKTLSFCEGDHFYLHQSKGKQRNWWHVVNRKGQVGFVPSNYVASMKVEPEFLLSFLNDCLRNLSDDLMNQKQELISKLNEKKRHLQMILKAPSKKPPAPKPPPRFDDSTPPNGVSPSFDLRPVVSQQNMIEEKEESPTKSHPINTTNTENSEVVKKENVRKGSIVQLSSDTDNQDDSQDSSDSIKPNAIYEIVQSVRKETQLSHEMSRVAVETVLVSLRVFLVGHYRLTIIAMTGKPSKCGSPSSAWQTA
ncbi:hypothetical protein EVAR_79562_1 [Eumeta japonica]|uniref:SH3 domain-containing protein n=1 Tax=Eumeta variegata TaxID=151549 RepID=A0A4C1UE53_EUMVA|nr:hypothetical protein EVAR_79562_1 [Eumeta japonica]